MAGKSCCDKPCLTSGWVTVRGRRVFGQRCLNCRRFTPDDGGKPFKLPAS